MNPPLIIAHRGASHDAAENTLAAFHLAWEQGADAIETDLRLTADGEIVAFHDADFRRLFHDSRRLCETPRAALDPKIPTLREVLAIVPPGKQLVLELKEDLVAELARELRDAPRDRITLIAFDAEIIAAAKHRMPACRALWLVGDLAKHRGKSLAERVRELGIDGVDLRHGLRLNAALLAPLRSEGRTIFTYTVNHSASVRRCARLGLDGITTDRPADARRWLGIST